MPRYKPVVQQEARYIQEVPVGEYLKVVRGRHVLKDAIVAATHPKYEGAWTKKVYKNAGYSDAAMRFIVDDMDDCSRERMLRKDTIVLVGFSY
jgi:hypothetical protein